MLRALPRSAEPRQPPGPMGGEGEEGGAIVSHGKFALLKNRFSFPAPPPVWRVADPP